jgi:hypothetical protein
LKVAPIFNTCVVIIRARDEELTVHLSSGSGGFKRDVQGFLKGKPGDASDFNFATVDTLSRGESLQFTIAHMRFPLSKKKSGGSIRVERI